ncbi:MAG TPA: acyltransferase [Steroidobacteraceae bacterium]|nr:acyltransferase [Steroidobacteraceae bacterium]
MLANLKGVLTIVLLTLNVIFWFVPIFIIAVLKLVLPVAGWRRLTSRWLTWFGEHWVRCNQGIFAITQNIAWDIRGVESLQPRDWYLVVSNHRSWVDILILQGVFVGHIPFLKFFIKQQLRWVPFLGLAWWAMDMPFMKRYTREQIERDPSLKGRDLATTRRACEKFRTMPTSIINFVEGTRYTPAKKQERSSPYEHLLPPRAGGIAFVLSAMGDILHRLLDVTIVYRPASPSLWDLCTGKLERVVVHVRERPIERWLVEGDYLESPEFRDAFQRWLTGVWSEKDALIGGLLEEPGMRGLEPGHRGMAGVESRESGSSR